MEITVRSYTDTDAEAIAELERECFAEPWSQNAIKEAAAYGTRFFLAECGGSILGYIGIKPVIDEGYISNVAVSKPARGKGVATRLMEAVSLYAKENGIKTVSLEVRPSNSAALALYDKFGYNQVGRRKNFYSRPTEDALILTLEVE